MPKWIDRADRCMNVRGTVQYDRSSSRRIAVGRFCSVLSLLCSLFLQISAAAATERVPLKAAIFEYIPGYEKDKLQLLRSEIEKRFEQEHQDIDLQLAPLSNRDNLYDFDEVKGWLTRDNNEYFNVLEVDSLLLGDLAEVGAIQPLPSIDTSDQFPVGVKASQYKGKMFGIPHLLCSYFLFSFEPALIRGSGQKKILHLLRSDNDDAIDLVGEFNGSWGLPAMYLDAWLDRHKGGDPRFAFQQALSRLDGPTVADLKNMIKLCENKGKNICFSGDYEDSGGSNYFIEMLSFRHANAMIGYSERLHIIRKIAKKEQYIGIRSAPFGDGDNPIMFADSFVIGDNCKADCAKAALTFAKFMNSKQMMEYLLLAQDLDHGVVARYLLPATISAFEIPGIAQDKLYASLKHHIEKATPFPNSGFVQHRKTIRDKLKCAIEPSACQR